MLSALIRFNLRVLLNPPPHKSVSSLHIAESADQPRKVMGMIVNDCCLRAVTSLLNSVPSMRD